MGSMSKSGVEEFKAALAGLTPRPDRIFLLSDTNVAPLADAYADACRSVAQTVRQTVAAGEGSKSLEQVARLCASLSEEGATRASLMVNVGGGVVSDLGGFAASIFKRGIRTINVATTLLAAVDAAIGGKTGVDFQGLKNELGTFWMPGAVIVASELLPHQPEAVMTDGYAELVKTAMLSDQQLYRRVLDMKATVRDSDRLGEATRACARFKQEVVSLDPREKGLRRILNLGHTYGHAFESLLMERRRPVGHGTAVAHGLLCSLIMSHLALGLPSQEISFYRQFLHDNYPRLPIGCPDRDKILELISHDKKTGADGRPRMVLLEAIGKPVESYTPTDRDLSETLELYFNA